MNEIDTLAARIHEISTEKGFTPPSLDNLPEKLMLSVSELAEALEEHRSDKPLIYYKCGICGAERMAPDDVGDLHYVPRRGLVAHILQRLGIGDKMIRCPGVIDKPEGLLVEVGDATIRNLHIMHSILNGPKPQFMDGLTVSDVLLIKVDYNQCRPIMHGGRAY